MYPLSKLFISKICKERGLIAILMSTFGFGVAFGGYIPLISLWLETKNTSFSMIGLISSSASIGIILSAYMAPRLIKKIGYTNGAVGGIIFGSILGVIFRFTDNEIFWLLLRFFAGVGFGIHWVVTEAWLGHIVTDKGRTRAVSLYASAMAGGFSVGPLTIWITGVETILPFCYLLDNDSIRLRQV